ncbi:MAG: aminopeptidase P family N-terminal domain-containing protein, partial [Chloroflexota bacterium]|nr:aminopeptidase P family N-terminal domain-containing protein [Chloroflexota bacterium]
MPQIEYTEIALPDFGSPQMEPEIPAAIYAARLRETRERSAYSGYDALLIYGDREHFANIAYLTGYDPRFEETLLILASGRPPTLLVGNEGMAYAALSSVPTEKVLYQSFSLPGQPRGASKPLATILREAGVVPGAKIGIAGWKYFLPVETATPAAWIEAPAYLVDTLREMRCTALNATALFMDPAHGLRAINEVDQLACFEYAATLSSEAIKNVLFHVQPGMTEYDAVRLMGLNGFPLACHPMCSAGERAVAGLPSPS